MNEERQEQEIVKLSWFKWEARKRKVIAWFKGVFEYWASVFKDDSRMMFLVVPGIAWLVRRFFKSRDQRREDYHRNCQQYDRSCDIWYDLKRPMTNNEKIEFAQRRKRGEDVLSILKDMKLVKR